MSKKIYLFLFIALTVATGYYFIRSNFSVKNTIAQTEEKNSLLFSESKEKTDGPEEIMHREYLMTVDPSIMRIPSERLQIGEAQIAAQQSSRNFTAGASNIVWTERGPNNIGGRTRAILIDKNDGTGNTVWAGGAGGGLWKTINFRGACKWTQVAGISTILAITTITQDPTTPNNIYVGSGEGFGNIDAQRGLGVYATSDGGTVWTLLASTTTGGASVNDFYYVNKLLVHTNGQVYAATRSIYCNAGGVFRSTNNGVSWSRVLGVSAGTCAASTDTRGYDLEMTASGDLYATTNTGGTNTGKIWKSPAGAAVGNSSTWTNVTPTGSFQRIELAVSATNNSKIYALTQGATNATGGTRLTTDGGTTWSTIDVGNWCDQGTTNTDFTRKQAWYDLTLGVNPTNDAIAYAGGVDVFKTSNSGTGWSQLTQWNSGCASLPVVHADIHVVAFMPGASGNEFIVGNDGGLYYTTDGGSTFSTKNVGYNVTQYYGLAMHPTAGSDYMLAGAQDNGSHKFTSTGINSVTTVTGGDGGICHIDQDNPLFQFTSYTGFTFNRSVDGGLSFTNILNGAADRFINPSDYSSSNDIMYCGGAARNYIRILTITGTPVSSSLTNVASTTNHAVSALKVDPNGNDRLWVAFSTGDGALASVVPELYLMTSASGTAVKNTITLPAGIATLGYYISSLDVQIGDANHILLTLSNYGVTSVWESIDLGVNWTAIEGNLPDMPVRWGKFTPTGAAPNNRVAAAAGGILLATELGVWSTSTTSGGTTIWYANNAVMGNVRVDMIKVRPSDNIIGIATHGRGIFTGNFITVLPVVLESFTGKLQDKSALLNWTTSSEINAKHFELEKSFDGNVFKKIATIAAIGNSSIIKNYQYIDNGLLLENNYYRLKSVDFDNKSSLSNTVIIKSAANEQGIVVDGNPFSENISLHFVKKTVTVGSLNLLDASGRLVSSQKIGEGIQQLKFVLPTTLPKAVYYLHAEIDGKKYQITTIKK